MWTARSHCELKGGRQEIRSAGKGMQRPETILPRAGASLISAIYTMAQRHIWVESTQLGSCQQRECYTMLHGCCFLLKILVIIVYLNYFRIFFPIFRMGLSRKCQKADAQALALLSELCVGSRAQQLSLRIKCYIISWHSSYGEPLMGRQTERSL